MDHEQDTGPVCPRPVSDYPHVLLAHGGGGTLMNRLIHDIFIAAFGSPSLKRQTDAAVLTAAGRKLAFTTDSYVVSPLIFPGGNIGSLAVHGTINDLATSGARPLWLSAGFILEEGLPMSTLQCLVESMAGAAADCGVEIVTGDTKVVERGRGDGVYINTAGVGIIEHDSDLGPAALQGGDTVLLSGDLGRHGAAILAARENLAFETEILSDSAPLAAMVADLIGSGVQLHCLRDLTRGGLASAANELAAAAGKAIEFDETALPISEPVRAFGEVLGIDPLHIACEGRLVAFVKPHDAERAVAIMHRHEAGAGAVAAGRVREAAHPDVTVRGPYGTSRLLTMPSGEQLPRIC